MTTHHEGFDFFLSQVKHNLKDVSEFAYNFLLQQYQEIIQHTDDLLLQAARQIDSEDDKALLINAIDVCQRSRPQMQHCFSEQLLNAFQPLTGQRITQKSVLQASTDSSVNLISDADLDDRIQVQTIIAHARSHFEKWLDQITAALQAALPGTGITAITNPFGPTCIGNALFDSVQILGMGPLANKQIFTIFQRQLFHNLEPFYQQVLGRMSQAGISAHHPASSMASRTGREPLTDDAYAAQNNQFVLMQEPDYTANEWDAISLIQDGSVPDKLDNSDFISMDERARMEPHIAVSVLSRSAIDEWLASFQKGYDPSCDGDISDYLQQQLQLEATSHSRPILKRDDENIINLIGLVFNQIASQQQPDIANLFLRLKIAYVRLALTDELFFHDHLHPARQLLDRLLQLINGSNDDKALFKQVHYTVMKIQLRYKGDLDIFEELLDTVETYIQQESQTISNNHSELTTALETEENKRLARLAAAKLIDEHMQVLHHRLAFHQLLAQLWQEILADIYLKQGTDSQNWETALHLLDALILSTGSRNPEQLRQATRNTSGIVRELTPFLQAHEVTDSHRQLLLDQLQELQIQFVRGKTPADISDAMLSFTPNIQLAVDTLQRQQQPHTDFNHIGHQHSQLENARNLVLNPQLPLPTAEHAQQLVEQLAIGQWMSVVVDSQPRPAQAGFYSKAQQSYVFLDRQHQRLFERSKVDLALDLQQGYAAFLENVLSFDGAMASVNAKVKAFQQT